MTSVLFKILILTSIMGVLSGVIINLPNAQPLPSAITSGIDYLISVIYYFSDVLPVSTFFTVIYIMINAYIAFLTLISVKTIIKWTIRAS